MTDSNVWARKKRNVKNHLFMVHGIINSVINGKSACVNLQIYDLVKAFDALWVADCMNALWDTLPPEARDDRLGLLYQSSKPNLVAVNTAVGQSDRVNIPEIAQVQVIPLAMMYDLISITSCGIKSIEMNIFQ